VSWDSGLDAPDNSFVVHPAAFPKYGTLVIEVFFHPRRASPDLVVELHGHRPDAQLRHTSLSPSGRP